MKNHIHGLLPFTLVGLILVASVVGSCARADDSGIDANSSGGTSCTINCTGGSGGSGGSGGKGGSGGTGGGFDSGLNPDTSVPDLCAAVCFKLAAASCPNQCDDPSACATSLQGPCGPQQAAFFQCYVFTGNLTQDCDVTGCDQQKQDVILCQIDSCPLAKNGHCDEPNACPPGTDFTDCNQ